MKPLTVSELIEELKRHPNPNAEVVVRVVIDRRRGQYADGSVVNAKIAVNSVVLDAE